MSRREDVAKLAGVAPSHVEEVTAEEVRAALADRVREVILDVATQEPATYWRVGDSYYLDDPYFGPVVAFDQLDYDSDLGLRVFIR